MTAAALSAAAHANAPAPAIRPMYFEHVTMRDGLSMSTVNSILQDSQGYVWLATEGGLNRYDGYTIRQYRRERGSEHGLASDYVWSIAEDARGDIWLATDGGGVARWERRTQRSRIRWPAMECGPCSSTRKAEFGQAPRIKGSTCSTRVRDSRAIFGILTPTPILCRLMPSARCTPIAKAGFGWARTAASADLIR